MNKLIRAIFVITAGLITFMVVALVRNEMLPAEGPIVAKDYNPMWVQTTVVNNTPMTTIYPETWSVKLENGKWIYVSENSWDELKIGDEWGE